MCEESDVKLRQIFAEISTKPTKIDAPRADNAFISSPIDPLEEHWFEEGTSDIFVNEFSGNDDNLAIEYEDIHCDTNELDIEMPKSDLNESNSVENVCKPFHNSNRSEQSDDDDDEERAIVVRAKCVNGLWPCESCKKSFADHQSLKLHIRMHFTKNLQRCGSSAMQKHSSLRGTRRNKKLKCRVDTPIAAERNIFAKSDDDQMEIIRQNFNCKQCEADFDSFAGLVLHTTETHQQFDCDICGKTLATIQNLERHKQIHEKQKTNDDLFHENKSEEKKTHAKKFTCGICERRFSFKGNLK